MPVPLEAALLDGERSSDEGGACASWPVARRPGDDGGETTRDDDESFDSESDVDEYVSMRARRRPKGGANAAVINLIAILASAPSLIGA